MKIIKIYSSLSYSLIPILTILILIIINLFVLIIFKKKKPHKNIKLIRKKYLLKINILENHLNLKKINNKIAIQELSSIIRHYVYELSGIKVQNYSLKEIKKLKSNELTTLIEEIYEKEFSNKSHKNVKKIINKAKEFIKTCSLQ